MRAGLPSVCATLLVCALLAGHTAAAVPSAQCLECHGTPGEAAPGRERDPNSLFVGDWEQSVHGGFDCTDCHADVPSLPHAEALARPTCEGCHSAESDSYARSAHATHAAAGDSRAPRCATCHDPHSVRPSSDPKSTLYRSHLAQVCIQCHADDGEVEHRPTAVPHPALSYTQGAHQQAMAAGKLNAATCSDCHAAHDVRRAGDPESSVFRNHVPETCGRCHAAELEAFSASVHGQALQRGATGAPVCNSCHGEHAVARVGESGRATVVQSQTCESCHENPSLVRRYDLAAGAVSSYEDSYHGRAARGGLAAAAGCTSCHGTHRILAKSDPESSIHPENLVQTCAKCHAAATPAFAASYAHTPAQMTPTDRATALVRAVYLWLIGLTIGGMVLHNLVVWRRDLAREFAEHRAHATHVRMTRAEIWQHAALLVSFSFLVLTGFALRYPEAMWARALASAGLDEPVRRILHRSAAVVFMLTSLAHVVYLFTARGREQLRHLRPVVQDVRDALDNVLHHLGLRARPPQFRRFRYIEKAEYWALVWGTFVMVATGLVLWFPERLRGPSWFVRVAEAIHLYEAWLAFLAVIVWHLFFVLVRPGIRGGFTAITGRMELEELEHEHPAEYASQYGAAGADGAVPAAAPPAVANDEKKPPGNGREDGTAGVSCPDPEAEAGDDTCAMS